MYSSSRLNIIPQLLKHRYKVLCSESDFSLVRCYHTKQGVYGYKPKGKPDIVGKNKPVLKPEISQLQQFVNAYRDHGHKIANVNPIMSQTPPSISELETSQFGVLGTSEFNLDGVTHFRNKKSANLQELISLLEECYCGNLSVEFSHLEDEEKKWFEERVEESLHESIPSEKRKSIALEMLKSQLFENFLANKFTTVKRYGGEGAESMLAFFSHLFELSAKSGVEYISIGMGHRGRLSLMLGLLNFSPIVMFRKMKGLPESLPEEGFTGDVLSHLMASTELNYDGNKLRVVMAPTPSHLEAGQPVAVGKTRATQQMLQNGEGYSDDSNVRFGEKALCLQVHGDAAVTAQGVIMETLCFANCPHFEVGGSIHFVVNNHLGFTTPEDRGRSSRYCTDIGKMIAAPAIHVNADNPEAVMKATQLAFEYRQHFRKDIFVDFNCYRRWGHNELDDPTFTNPDLYDIIHNRRSITDLYIERLITEGLMTSDEVNEVKENYQSFLSEQLKVAENSQPPVTYLQDKWSKIQPAQAAISTWDTGINPDLLKYICVKSVEYPENFNVHPHLEKTHVTSRKKASQTGTSIDWSTAETMAIGSLLFQGYGVRISGQDVGRGTFSHRHVMLVDHKTDEMYIPLNSLIAEQQGFIEVVNSVLSEEAVMAFEYGMSLVNPNNLFIWEAQFGDFFNGAQIPIDVFISSGEAKWHLRSGLVLLLPHGMDGAGPEHSSSRLERFLQLTDSKEDGIDGDNVSMHIVHPTTPAQYFHLLRRQQIRNFRKPLIVIGPKVLLRLPQATSNLDEMSQGTSFKPVIGDKEADPKLVQRVIFVSGKHYYALLKQRETRGLKDVAIIRLEALTPFPTHELQQEVSKYNKVKNFVWSQEEHQNMGAWTFVRPRFQNLVGCKLKYAGRGPLSTPAVGIGQYHTKEVAEIMDKSFAV